MPIPATPPRLARRFYKAPRTSPATHFAVSGAGPIGGSAESRSSRQLTQHVLQNAAVPEVIELVQRVDAAEQRHALECPIAGHNFGHQPLARLQLAMQATDGDLLVAGQPQSLPRGAFLEYQGHHAHADQVRAMDALKRLGNDGADAE